jgi:alkaline phosphatase
MSTSEIPSATNRRGFLWRAGGWAAAWGMCDLAARESWASAANTAQHGAPLLRVGLLTDAHYADRPPGGSRHYRDSLAKLAAAGEQFAQAPTDLLIELGDFIDSADSLEAEKGFLRRVDAAFRQLPGARHYVLGNHCVSALTKAEFLEIVGQAKSHYSFDRCGIHFVILDACFRSDGVAYQRNNFHWADAFIPPDQLEWLRKDLETAAGPALVFVHQCLDAEPPYGIKNAPQVRQILEASGRVRAVFQGHHHTGGQRQIHGIHYVTLRAMVEGPAPENNAFALLDILPGNKLQLSGFGKQPSLPLASGWR